MKILPSKRLASVTLAAPLALACSAFAPPAHADDYIVDTPLSASDRCVSVSRNEIEIRSSTGLPFKRPVVWRTGESSLEIGGGVASFSVWGNVDMASSITLTGIPGAQLRVLDKQGGLANAKRGCGGRGSVSLQITAPGHPPEAVRGRLRFAFPLGDPFDLPVVLQPVPAGIDLRWPSRQGGGVAQGEHHDCLRANGGHVLVQGNTLEIGLNPDGPMPVGCDVFSLEAFALRDTRDVKSSTSFSGSGNDRNLGITQVLGLRNGETFAQPRSERLHALGELIRRDRPAASAPFAALAIDYAAAARALRARVLASPSVDLAQGLRPTVTRIGASPGSATAPPPRSIEFQVALQSLNNVAGLHGPMPVRLVETGAAASSNLAPDFAIRPICNDLNAVTITDTSTSGLAITRRELRAGNGQAFVLAAGTRDQFVRYPAAGVFNASLEVTDASGATRTVTRPVTIPRQPCANAGVGPSGPGLVGGGGDQPNVLPVRLFPERPLLRRIGGLGSNTMVPITFCSTLGNNESREVPVPELTWGVSSAQADAPTVRVELRDAGSGSVLSFFDSGPLRANSAPVTRINYPGRPARVAVVNVTGGDTMVEYGNQAGCFLDKDGAPARLDPAFVLVVDSLGAVAEGPDANNAESDNELRF